MDGRYLSTAQAARRLEMCEATVRDWAKRGRIANIETPIGRLLLTEDVERLRRERESRHAASVAA